MTPSKPLTPLQVCLICLPTVMTYLGLHIDVGVKKPSLCFACAWISRCREMRECVCVCVWMRVGPMTMRVNPRVRACACLLTVFVCLQLADEPRNLRQVTSICPWFEHCTNPAPSQPNYPQPSEPEVLRTKPRIHSSYPHQR